MRSLLSLTSKRELLLQIAPRYKEASPALKTVILDEFVAATGYARKYAIRLLSQAVAPKQSIERPRPPHYGPEVMNSQAQQPSPCSECGGARVTVGYGQSEMFLGYTTGGLVRRFPFWAVCCTQCGRMTRYASQAFIAQALKATRQQQLREQQELAKRAEREQKRQEKKGLF